MGSGKKWTEDTIIKELNRVMKLLAIEHLPTYIQLEVYSTCASRIKLSGGLKYFSKLMNVPMTKNLRNSKRVHYVDVKIRPSKAFEIEKQARLIGLSYADIQKSNTLRELKRCKLE